MNPPASGDEVTDQRAHAEIRALLPALVARAPGEAAETLDHYPNDFVAQMLESLNPGMAQSVLERFGIERRQKIIAAAPPPIRQHAPHARIPLSLRPAVRGRAGRRKDDQVRGKDH